MKTERTYSEAELRQCPTRRTHWFTDVDAAYLPECIHCGAPRKAIQALQKKTNQANTRARQQRKRAEAVLNG